MRNFLIYQDKIIGTMNIAIFSFEYFVKIVAALGINLFKHL